VCDENVCCEFCDRHSGVIEGSSLLERAAVTGWVVPNFLEGHTYEALFQQHSIMSEKIGIPFVDFC
jgi:hypothetical protein